MRNLNNMEAKTCGNRHRNLACGRISCFSLTLFPLPFLYIHLSFFSSSDREELGGNYLNYSFPMGDRSPVVMVRDDGEGWRGEGRTGGGTAAAVATKEDHLIKSR